jgi:hypothetical protein
MHDRAAKRSAPFRHIWDVAVATRDDDALRFDRVVARDETPPTIAPVDPLDLCSASHVEGVMIRIPLEVLDDAIPGRPLPERAGDSISGQTRQPANGVKVQPVVARRPSRADGAALEDDHVAPVALQHRGGSKSRRTCSDDDDHGVVLHPSRQGPERNGS